MPRCCGRLGRIAATLVLLGCLAAPALAQDEEQPAEFPDVELKERTKPYVQWVLGTLFIAAVIGLAMKNPHRTHLD